ncbi:hypothetical protein QTP86_016791 [Hemibagrus guttatus]|nr:hypothetical protein QTP86_016791 [Hemibagrus guttatus]
MGRGSPIPPMLRRKIVEQYQKGVFQREIAKSLKLSSSTVHNIIQRFRESGTISVRKGQGRKTILDARDLRALRRHCITYRNATVMEITTWAQEYFQKTLSVNTIHRAIRHCRLKLYRSKKKPYLNMIQKHRRFLWAKAHLKWTVAKWKTVLWSDESKFEVLFGKLGRYVIRNKEDQNNTSCYQRSVQKPASLMWEIMHVLYKGNEVMSSNIIEIPALGRPLHPGTLYDCRSDSFIPACDISVNSHLFLISGITLWDKETLRNCLASRRQPKTDLNFSASDTLSDKSNLLNVNASLKASILGGLVDVAGSARYIRDNKSSAHQSRVSLQYNHTTKFEQLTMSQLRNVTYPKVFEDGTATHVVTAVLYGAQAFMVFEIAASENEDKEEIEGNLNVMVRKIPSLSIEGGGALKMNDHEKKMSDSIKCIFYGDYELELNPTTYLEALHVYKTLPSLLRERENDAVPMKVWLYPLALLNKKAAILQREIHKTLITKAEAVLEELENAEILCNDLITNTKVNDFPDVKLRMKTFQNMLLDYKVMFQKAMRKFIPAIRGGTMEEKAMADIIKIHHKSPFRPEKLNEWLEYNQSEQNLLAVYTQQVSDVPVIKHSALYSNILTDTSIDNVVCFCFNSLKNEDPYLSTLTKFLKVDEFESLSTIPESADSEVFQGWFQNREVMEKTKDNHSLFRSFFQANKDEAQTRFVIVSIPDPSILGTCIHLYRKGKLVDKMFQPVSKPPPPTFEIQNKNLILKLQRSPTGTTIKFRVEYMLIQATDSKSDEEKWEAIDTPDAQETFTLPDFELASQFCIRYRAISEVGVSEVSNSALYSPKGILKIFLGQRWNGNYLSIVNELRNQLLGNLGASWLKPSAIKSEVKNRVNNPKIPYVSSIPGKIRVGMAFYLQGVVSEKLGDIIFSLKTGARDYDDTAFQLLLKPNEGCVCSAAKHKSWLTGSFQNGCPLYKGSIFAVFIVIKNENYEVYMNGRRCFMFKQNIQLGRVSTIYIHGDFVLNTFGIVPNWSASTFSKEQSSGISDWELSIMKSDIKYPVCKPDKPYLTTIPGGLKIGMALFFQGVVPLGSKGFEIALKTGPQKDDDVAFLFKTTLGSVVFNSRSTGQWQKELSDDRAIFAEGEAFDVFMLITPGKIYVTINGQEFSYFEEKIPIIQVSTIDISGDVFMNTFGIIDVENANATFEVTSLN